MPAPVYETSRIFLFDLVWVAVAARPKEQN